MGWEGRCSVPTSIPASPPGMAGANGICTVIRDLIYQPLMGSGKIEFLAICGWGGIRFGAVLRSRVWGAGGWQSCPPQGFPLCLYRDCSYFPCLRGSGGGIQLLIAVKVSRNCGGLTTQMGKLRHGQEKPKAHDMSERITVLVFNGSAPSQGSGLQPPPCLSGVPKLWPGHPKGPDTLHLPELSQRQ